jgi:hypothetical protein
MSMHMEGPWLSLTGKRKGKKKFASAEQKQQAELLEAEWQKLKDRYAPKIKLSKGRSSYIPPKPMRRDADQPRIPSLDTGVKGAVNVRMPMQYTGDNIVGIGTMHKSNAVPIFTDQEAKDISSMRR